MMHKVQAEAEVKVKVEVEKDRAPPLRSSQTGDRHATLAMTIIYFCMFAH